MESRQDIYDYWNKTREETGSGTRATVRTGLNMGQSLPANVLAPMKGFGMLMRYGGKAWKALPTWGKVTTGAGGAGGAGWTIWDQFKEEGE